MNRIVSILLVLVGLSATAQNDPLVFYSNADALMPAKKYEDFKDRMTKQFSTQGMDVTFQVYKETRRNDSLIRYYNILANPANGTKSRSKHFDEIETGKPLPDIALKKLNGDIIYLSDLKGKPIVLNFWHTTCYPCIREMPQLNKIKNDYSDKVHFLSVTDDDAEKVKGFLQNNEFNFTHIVNAHEFSDSCGIYAVPKLFFIDRNGYFQKAERGIALVKEEAGDFRMGSDAYIRDAIDEMLKINKKR